MFMPVTCHGRISLLADRGVATPVSITTGRYAACCPLRPTQLCHSDSRILRHGTMGGAARLHT
jgi:hypothetical protein